MFHDRTAIATQALPACHAGLLHEITMADGSARRMFATAEASYALDGEGHAKRCQATIDSLRADGALAGCHSREAVLVTTYRGDLVLA